MRSLGIILVVVALAVVTSARTIHKDGLTSKKLTNKAFNLLDIPNLVDIDSLISQIRITDNESLKSVINLLKMVGRNPTDMIQLMLDLLECGGNKYPCDHGESPANPIGTGDTDSTPITEDEDTP